MLGRPVLARVGYSPAALANPRPIAGDFNKSEIASGRLLSAGTNVSAEATERIFGPGAITRSAICSRLDG